MTHKGLHFLRQEHEGLPILYEKTYRQYHIRVYLFYNKNTRGYRFRIREHIGDVTQGLLVL